MEIKSIDTSSIPKVATLLRKYWKERGMLYTQKWAEQYLDQGHKIEIKQEQTFTIQEKEKILGTISVIIWEGNVAELRDLTIKKEHRGKGLGKKLIDYAIEWCRRKNLRKLFALTFPENKPVFETCSFTLEGFLKDHFKQGENLLIMSQFLTKKKDTQVNLKAKLEDMRKVEDIERETATRLRKLST